MVTRADDRRSPVSTLARWCRRLIAGLLLAAVLVVGGTAVRVWQVARIDDWTTADAIVVLGAAQYSGTPSPVFEARLEQARKLYENGVSDTIVTVGGKQEGDLFTEAPPAGTTSSRRACPRMPSWRSRRDPTPS